MLKNQEMTTIGTFLMVDRKNEDGFQELIEITGYPDLGGAPEAIEVTTLSDTATKFIPGLDVNETLEFTAVYNVESFAMLKELEGQELDYAIWFGSKDDKPHGQYGKFTLKGALAARVAAGEINEARTATIHIIPSSEIRFDGGSE